MTTFPPLTVEIVKPCQIEGRMYEPGQVVLFDYELARSLLNAGFAIPEGYEPPVERRPIIGRFVH